MALTDTPPPPPPNNVKWFNADGTPTKAMVEYVTKLTEYLKKLTAAIP